MTASAPSLPASPDLSLSNRGLLALGALLVAIGAYRRGVGLAAWLAPVPFLLVMRRADRWRTRLLVLAVLAGATFVQVAKIMTAPLAVAAAVPFALAGALAGWLVLLATEAIRRRGGERAGLLAYAALSALVEWIRFHLSPLGAWGSAASMHADDLALAQLASVAGVAGIGLCAALVPATIAMLLAAPRTQARLRAAIAVAAVLGLVHAWGAVRLFSIQHGPTVRVAGVVTDVGLGPDGLPSPAELAATEDVLFERTRTAAARGAQVIAWNEVATVVTPADEARIVARGAATARELGVELVMAYGVSERSPVWLDNKYVWFAADGAVVETYRKHHPVPGEPSMRGTAPLVAHDHPWGRAAGAICYDYDFPAMARAHGRLGAGLVVVPSSDWRGIDPFHTAIARLGAISGGFSLVRPVRWATSAAFDAYGRTRATMAGFGEDDGRIMMATVPVTSVPTLYRRFGDAPVVAVALAMLALAGLAIRRARARG
jgi:apolipoprotein N-acyltransferase